MINHQQPQSSAFHEEITNCWDDAVEGSDSRMFRIVGTTSKI